MKRLLGTTLSGGFIFSHLSEADVPCLIPHKNMKLRGNRRSQEPIALNVRQHPPWPSRHEGHDHLHLVTERT